MLLWYVLLLGIYRVGTQLPSTHLKWTTFWTILKMDQYLLTCLEVECSRHCAGKQALLPSQWSEVANVGIKRNEVTMGAFAIGLIKGTHGIAPVKVHIWSTVDPVDILIPAAVCELSVGDGRWCEVPIRCLSKCWGKEVNVLNIDARLGDRGTYPT